MANRYFNKQVAESRKPLADGGPAGGKDDPKRNLGPRKRSPGPRSGRPTKKPNTIEKKILDPRTREQLKERFSKKKYAPEFKKNSILIPKKNS